MKFRVSPAVVGAGAFGRNHLRVYRELQGAGFSKLFNVAGGILAWADRIDPSIAKY